MADEHGQIDGPALGGDAPGGIAPPRVKRPGKWMGVTCAARTRSGGACQRRAGWGTPHLGYGRCSVHGGSTPSHRKAAALDAAMSEAAAMGVGLEVQPHEALLHCVFLAARQVHVLSNQVRQLADGELLDGQLLHPTIRAQQDSMDRLARLSKLALDAGIAERQVRIVEGMAERLATVIQAVVGDLALTAGQRARLPEAFARHMPMLEPGGAA